MTVRCICGDCGRQNGLELHHVLTQQRIRRALRDAARGRSGPPDIVREMALIGDRRNMVPISPKCHAAHHNRSRPLSLRVLPDSAFEFARELLGAGPAFEYMRRFYSGTDPRLDALLEAWEAAA